MEQTNNLESKTLIQLLEQVVESVQDKGLKTEEYAQHEAISIAAERLQLSPMQVVFLSAFINRFEDRHITISDLAKFFGCKSIRILSFWSDIEALTKKRYIQQKTDDDESSFLVPFQVMETLRDDNAFTPKSYEGLNAQQWCEELSNLLEKRNDATISDNILREDIETLIKVNQNLNIAAELNNLNEQLLWNDFLLFIVIMDLFIQNGDEHVIRYDIEDLFESKRIIRRMTRDLEAEDHVLQKMGLVECCNNDGQVESNAWHLTDKAKKTFLSELTLKSSIKQKTELKSPQTITPKQLYYNVAVTRQVQTLTDLLKQERFVQVQERLAQHGMRRGIACIFYGAPGTGKTETVLQLARQTGRSVMQVDIPNLRSKWVGDTEKNIKAVFDRYRSYCEPEELAPILLFNEADAVLCKRNEGAVDSVDKMENAMQNIILQEMETLDGIMIATTNLTGNLDAAFERRFLYKIEFPKPTADESRHIWQSMLPDITEADAIGLAKSYNFSGGQIENIARKQIVDSILSGEDTVSMSRIREACETESFKHSTDRRIGFC